MVDTMLYADLDLDVKLSDAITGLKDNKKASQKLNGASEQVGDNKPMINNPVNSGVPGVGVNAAQAAGMNQQYDPATVQLWQSLLMQAARNNKMPAV